MTRQKNLLLVCAACRSNGTVAPVGKLVKTGVKNPNGYTLNYNEFIVYNTNQIRMKYLAKVQFDFKY